MQLQQFVTEVVEEMGGVVSGVEYALCQVLIPEVYAPHFQHKTELQLAFDYEVAQEHPEAEFVTFGSYILEQLLDIVHRQTVSTRRYAVVDRLALGNALKKIKEFLKEKPGQITIEDEKPMMGIWAVFQYSVSYVADEKMQSAEQVWVNLINNEISPTMKAQQNRIMYQNEPVCSYPVPVLIDVQQAFDQATLYVKEVTDQHKNDSAAANAMAKDVERITNYYAELIAENDKRINRKGLSLDKKKEHLAKSEAIKLEQEKQLQEIRYKYSGQVEINIDNGILYFIPLLQYHVQLTFRGNVTGLIVYHNPITKEFFKG